MLNSKLVKNLISLLIIIALVYFGYYYLTKKETPASTTAQDSIVVQSADGTGTTTDDTAISSSEKFLSLMKDVDRIDFKSVTLFSNQVFSSVLQDFRQVLPNRPMNRVNPFSLMEANVRSTVYSDDIIGRKTILPLTSSSSLPLATSTATTTTGDVGR